MAPRRMLSPLRVGVCALLPPGEPGALLQRAPPSTQVTREERLLSATPRCSSRLVGLEGQGALSGRLGLGAGGASVPPAHCDGQPLQRTRYSSQSPDNNGIRVNDLGTGEQCEQTHNAFFVSDSWVP